MRKWIRAIQLGLIIPLVGLWLVTISLGSDTGNLRIELIILDVLATIGLLYVIFGLNDVIKSIRRKR